ncbi:Cullin repeat-like-containing domain protein [Mycena olivaceomarginata]|nr:Cullin repeat-like-containing domain protein [Mycena olivaceomarginata]
MDWYLNDWTRRLTGVPSVARALWLLSRKTTTFVYMAFGVLRMDGRMYRRDLTPETLQDEALLRYYAAEWDGYTTGADYLHRPFTYLGRQGKKGVYQVSPSPSGANTSSHPSNPHSPPPSCASSPPTLVKKVVDSFVSLGLDAADPNKECLEVYKEQFEAPFLTATEAYYSAEAEAFLNTGRAEKGEWEYPGALLDFDADEDLQRITRQGRRARRRLRARRCPRRLRGQGRRRQGQGRGKAGELDPKAYVDALLAVHEKNAATAARSFKGEAGFAVALDKACSELVNRNAATGGAARLLELLAKRADMLLKKSNKVALRGR